MNDLQLTFDFNRRDAAAPSGERNVSTISDHVDLPEIPPKNFLRQAVFITVSLMLLGISTCLTDSRILIFFNKLGIFCLFFYLVLHNLYQDKNWGLPKYAGAIATIVFSSLCHVFKPFSDFSAFRKSHSPEDKISEGKGKYVLLGVVIALPLLFIILLLLGSADAVFGNILENIFTFDFIFS